MPWSPETELAYLAGLIDGEGCLGVYMSRDEGGSRQKRGRTVYRARLTITNTHREVLDWVASRFGGGVSKKGAPAGCKCVYRWEMRGSGNVQRLITRVRPYLIVKSMQADLVLRFPVGAVCNQWTPHTSEVQAAKEALYLATKQLNQRGFHALDS